MKFSTLTLGCKVNQFETQAMENILISNGHILTKVGEGCDVCIINTCTVTAISAGKSRKAIRRLKKLEPNALIAVCGCLSQLEPNEIIEIGVDIIGGSGDRREFVRQIESKTGDGSLSCFRPEQDREPSPVLLIDNPKNRKVFEKLPVGLSSTLSKSNNNIKTKTRASLKIQDGCNNYCAYCVIPYARGRSRSLPLHNIAEHAKLLNEQGFREIVITGIEISSYGKDLENKPTLINVLNEVSAAASNTRIRLGSLDPSLITEDFCKDMSKIDNICDHFHLSVQSGCDETLKRMGRKYTTSDVLNAISTLRAFFPNCGITTDLLVGFPGETDEEFEKTQQFIKQAAFSDMHIFPFSSRPYTKAAKMPNQVKKDVKTKRAKLASEIALEMSHDFKQSQIGKTLEVLFERKRDGMWCGYSTNYLEVSVTTKNDIRKNSVANVVMTSVGYGKLSIVKY